MEPSILLRVVQTIQQMHGQKNPLQSQQKDISKIDYKKFKPKELL